MKKLKDEVKAHRQSDRLNDDDALPDVLTDEMIQQLFHTDQTTPMTHTNVLNESNASAQIDAHPATNSSVVTPPLMSPSKQNNNQLASRGGRMSKNSNMNRISNDTHERRNVSLRGCINDNDVGGEASKRNRVNTMNVNEKVNENKNKKRKDASKDEDEMNKKKRNEKSEQSKNESVSVVPRRGRGRPRKHQVDDVVVAAVTNNNRNENNASTRKENENNDDPETYEQATKSRDRNAWLDAMNDELRAHRENNTWSVVKRNASMNVIDTKWVYVKKKDENGVVKRFKARVVAKGYSQQYGIDYRETFAPVIKLKSLRLIIALSSTTNTKRRLEQLDVKTAFLNAKVKEDIYVSVPKGMSVGVGVVLKLNKALYGIKQAPHEWNNEIDSFIQSIGFTQCIKDTCVYVKMSKTNNVIILGLFVDDMIISYDDRDVNEWNELKGKLMNKYKLSDEGEANVIVGMKLTRKGQNVYVDQRAYVREKLEEFKLTQCKEMSTPGDVNVQLNGSKGEVDKHAYMQITGSLIYVPRNFKV